MRNCSIDGLASANRDLSPIKLELSELIVSTATCPEQVSSVSLEV
ncbi:MAG: hypothetical protein ACI9XU_000626 [Arenicella sp.]|jgi:hypothetical protein